MKKSSRPSRSKSSHVAVLMLAHAGRPAASLTRVKRLSAVVVEQFLAPPTVQQQVGKPSLS